VGLCRGATQGPAACLHVAEDDAKSRNAHRQCAPGCFVCRCKSPWPPSDGSGVDDEGRRLPARRTCDALVASQLPAAILVCNSRPNCNRLSTDPVAVRRVTSYALSCSLKQGMTLRACEVRPARTDEPAYDVELRGRCIGVMEAIVHLVHQHSPAHRLGSRLRHAHAHDYRDHPCRPRYL